MTDHLECLECGAIVQAQCVVPREALAARGFEGPGDCDDREDVPACPLCDSADLAEAIFDVRDCARLLKAAFPEPEYGSSKVSTWAATYRPWTLYVTLCIGDMRQVSMPSTTTEERLGSVFRRALAAAVKKYRSKSQ